MSVVEIFSKRQKRLRGEVPDVYQYDEMPHELRVQVVHILDDALGEPYYEFNDFQYHSGTREAYEFFHKALCREYGIFTLDENAETDYHRVVNFLLETEDAEKALDVIELSLQYIDPTVHGFNTLNIAPGDAITELNQRFHEHGVGYQYESGQINRIDSQFVHSKAVQPALKMLSASMYEGANAEFLSAHAHYRAKRYKECLNDCLKAFESCLKSICHTRQWHYGETDNAKRLIDIVFDNGLIPKFMKSHFSGLRGTLEAGVPTLRNKRGGHGQGMQKVPVPKYIGAYALHLTASNILLLASAEENLPPDIPF